MKKQRPQIRHNLKNAEEAKKRLMEEDSSPRYVTHFFYLKTFSCKL